MKKIGKYLFAQGNKLSQFNPRVGFALDYDFAKFLGTLF